MEKVANFRQKCQFYNGLITLKSFNVLYKIVSPFIRRSRRGRVQSVNKGKAKKFGPKWKLASEEELLITLMKLRLGSLSEELADKFNDSCSLISSIFKTWIKALSNVLKPTMFSLEKGN